jgi:hypothetical protein
MLKTFDFCFPTSSTTVPIIRRENESGISRPRDRSDRLFNRSHIVHAGDGELYAERVGARSHARREALVGRRFGIVDDGCATRARRDLLEKLYPLAAHARLISCEARNLAAGLREALDKAPADRVGNADEDDQNSAGLSLESRKRGARIGEDNVW